MTDKEQATDTNKQKAKRDKNKVKLNKPPKKKNNYYLPELRMWVSTDLTEKQSREEHLKRNKKT